MDENFRGLYEIDKEENSFILIPKNEVLRIWCEEREVRKISCGKYQAILY